MEAGREFLVGPWQVSTTGTSVPSAAPMGPLARPRLPLAAHNGDGRLTRAFRPRQRQGVVASLSRLVLSDARWPPRQQLQGQSRSANGGACSATASGGLTRERRIRTALQAEAGGVGGTPRCITVRVSRRLPAAPGCERSSCRGRARPGSFSTPTRWSPCKRRASSCRPSLRAGRAGGPGHFGSCGVSSAPRSGCRRAPRPLSAVLLVASMTTWIGRQTSRPRSLRLTRRSVTVVAFSVAPSTRALEGVLDAADADPKSHHAEMVAAVDPVDYQRRQVRAGEVSGQQLAQGTLIRLHEATGHR